MTSEAAQKAYPAVDYGMFNDYGWTTLLEAFDRGAVEALRQAAEEFDVLRPTPYVSDEEWTRYEVATATRSFLLRMAEKWEAGQ